MNKFRGTGVALITPFKGGKVDFLALEKIIQHTIAGGVDFIVSLGTTGEDATLNEAESLEVLQYTSKINNGRVPLVAGNFGGNNTAALVDKIEGFDFSGIDAIMSSSPAYVKPNQEGIYQHYMALATASPIPIIIYNVPGRTSSNVTAATIVRLANASKKFVAIKDASGSIEQGTKIIKDKPDHLLFLSGDDENALALVGCGSDGVISVIANSHPEEYATMIRSSLNEDYKTAQAINHRLLDVHHYLYVEGNPVGIKAAMEILGFCKCDVRLPLSPMSAANYKGLEKELQLAQNSKLPKVSS